MEKEIPYQGFTGSSKEQLQTLLPLISMNPGRSP